MHIICFVLLAYGLLTLFNIRMLDLISILSRRKAVTLTD